MYLNVSNIQHFSIGDGPGIRSTVFLKGCNLHCPWCHNPENISFEIQILRYAGTGKIVTAGKTISVDEVIKKVLADTEFYRQSGGGVTVSGGEPLLQADSVAEFCRILHSKKIHTLIDTAGNVPWESFETVLPYTDCFFFDWKSPSPEIYDKVIGGDFKLIEGNLRNLIDTGKEVHVRMPIIPGINDRISDIEQSVEKLKKIGVKKVDLLPFHRMGIGKYKALGIPYAYAEVSPPSEEHMEEIARAYRNDFCVTIEN